MKYPANMLPFTSEVPDVGDIFACERTGDKLWRVASTRADIIFAHDMETRSESKVFVLEFDRLYPIGTTRNVGYV